MASMLCFITNNVATEATISPKPMMHSNKSRRVPNLS